MLEEMEDHHHCDSTRMLLEQEAKTRQLLHSSSSQHAHVLGALTEIFVFVILPLLLGFGATLAPVLGIPLSPAFALLAAGKSWHSSDS